MDKTLKENIQLKAKKLLNEAGSYIDNHRDLEVIDSNEICHEKVEIKANGNLCEMIIDTLTNRILDTTVYTWGC